MRAPHAPGAAAPAPPTAVVLLERRESDRLIRFTKGQDEVARLRRQDDGRWAVHFDQTYSAAAGAMAETEAAGRALINAALVPGLRVRGG